VDRTVGQRFATDLLKRRASAPQVERAVERFADSDQEVGETILKANRRDREKGQVD
jgi:hypothetical protein